MAASEALHKEFQTFVQNPVVEKRKNISPENWSYCSTKVVNRFRLTESSGDAL